VKKLRIGRVVSDRMDKTVVVKTERAFRHPLYGKIMKRTRRFKAHDPQNACKIGDKVELTETKPLAKDKRWRVTKILEKAK
jgi:small subunit ribosomal protein S17